jgi:hypothetical protein
LVVVGLAKPLELDRREVIFVYAFKAVTKLYEFATHRSGISC